MEDYITPLNNRNMVIEYHSNRPREGMAARAVYKAINAKWPACYLDVGTFNNNNNNNKQLL